MSSNNLIYLGCVVLVILWGTAFTLVGYAVDYISPYWMVSIRTSVAAVALCAYARFRGHRLPPLSDTRWLWYTAMGFFALAAPFTMFAIAQKTISSGLAAILAGVMPLITLVLAHFLVEGETLSLRKTIGFVIGFIGVTVLFLPDPENFDLVKDWKSQALALGAAVFYAISTITAKRAPETPASLATAMMLIAGAIISTGFALISGPPTTSAPPSAWIALIALALGATGVANIIYLQIINLRGPVMIARTNYFVPMCSVIAGMVFLHEEFEWRIVVAMAIIIGGVMIASAKGKKL